MSALNLRGVYHSKSSSLLDDFYIPALSISKRYDRAVGFFSSSMLAFAAKGLSSFVHGDGRMRLVIGFPLTDDEYNAYKQGAAWDGKLREAEERLREILNAKHSTLTASRIQLLCYLVASERLKIRVALTAKGMFHDKTGILEDSYGNKIVFQGSANETVAAISPDFNYESIAVYPNWKQEIFQEYGEPFELEFYRLWEGRVEGVVTAEVLSSTYSLLKARAPKTPPLEITVMDGNQDMQGTEKVGPSLPKIHNGVKYELKPHQRAALLAWSAQGHRGILNMATGAGKTVVSLHAATEIANAISTSMLLVVLVPYQNLADQWVENAELYNFRPVKAYKSISIWQRAFSEICSSLKLPGNNRKYCVVTVKNTFISDEFQGLLRKIPPERLFIIGDECHHYKTAAYTRAVPSCKYSIGLSATPWREGDFSARASLEAGFGHVCYEYSIDDAMRDAVLCPYKYFPKLVHLEDAEYEGYVNLSKEIARLFLMKENGAEVSDLQLSIKLMERSRILGSAAQKFVVLNDLLSARPVGSKALFYCGDGSTEEFESSSIVRDIERVGKILNDCGWRSSRFTANESASERHRILSNFIEEYIDALVSIRVLDEGIDIPDCRVAYLLASSRNERQYVQRRGRILRKATGKEYSIIFDFICLPPQEVVDGFGDALVAAELRRFDEFSRLALNFRELESLRNGLADQYSVAHIDVDREEDHAD